MMFNKSLRELAHICNTLGSADRNIDCAIWEALFGNEMYKSIELRGGSFCIRYYPGPPGPEYHRLPRYTESIDDALTLVPHDYEWLISNRAPEPHKGRAYIHNRELHFKGITLSGPSGPAKNPDYIGFETTAMTPVLALCSVALQARAKMLK